MKFLAVLAVAVACASADVPHAAPNDESYAPVVKSEYSLTPEGAYEFAYETGNGIFGRASAVVANENSETAFLRVQGNYKYQSPDGENIELAYIADENGYQPQGNHLPVAPPTPEAILRSLAYNAAHSPPAEGAREIGKVVLGKPSASKFIAVPAYD